MKGHKCAIPVVIKTDDIHLSGLLAEPAQSGAASSGLIYPRGLILALHGGGYSSGYWNCPSEGASLLELGSLLGYYVLALDRPGYEISRDFSASRLHLADQVEFLFDAIESWSDASKFAGPVFVIGHSVGGILTLLMASHKRSTALSGVDVAGVPIHFSNSEEAEVVHSFPVAQTHCPLYGDEVRKPVLFGPEETYSNAMDKYDATLPRPMPVSEYQDALDMPNAWPVILPRIRLPVQFTLAEHESMMEADSSVLEEARSFLSNSCHCITHFQKASGHNTSTHRIARAYHMRAIAFFEECLALEKI